MPPDRDRESEAAQNTSTCDRCRVLKVKCLADEPGDSPNNNDNVNTNQARCRRCARSGHECTYNYSFKRSGRPPGSKNRSKRSDSDSSRPNHFSPNHQQHSQPRRPPPPTAPPAAQQHRPQVISPHVHQHHISPSHHISPQLDTHSSTQSQNALAGPSTAPAYQHDPFENSFNLIPPSLHLPPSGNEGDQGGDGHHWGPARDSIFGSARTTLEATDYHSEWMNGMFPSSRRQSFDFTLPQPQTDNNHNNPNNLPMAQMRPSSSQNQGVHGGLGGGNLGHDQVGSSRSSGMGKESGRGGGVPSGQGQGRDQGQSLPWSSGTGVTNEEDMGIASFSSLGGPVAQVESIGGWSEFCFFFSLFMRHQHALVPLMHKPTFAMDVLNRRDQRDEAFRGLLFSIVTYTICQCPINIMSNEFTRERLHELLGKCQHASRIIQLRHIAKPNLVIGASTCLDILSSQATNKPHLTAALFSDAQRIVYSLKLNLQQPSEGLSSIDLEISRRVFWQIYNTDKTNVMNGGHMLISDHEGVPPLPLEVDDDYLSTSGRHPPSHHTTQQASDPALSSSFASDKLSYMSGYVAVVQIFRILGECQLRHRTLLNDPTASQGMDMLMLWLELAFDRLRKITDSLPGDLRGKDRKGGEAGEKSGSSIGAGLGMSMDSDADATAGIQQANIIITALCAEFALLDFKAALRPEEDLMSQRETIAKKAYSTLSSIPIEYLASNGEAMRGKVLRTILALFHASSSPEELGGSVWDWWSMYSQVQFIQVIPAS